MNRATVLLLAFFSSTLIMFLTLSLFYTLDKHRNLIIESSREYAKWQIAEEKLLYCRKRMRECRKSSSIEIENWNQNPKNL